jgi:hypothetical protein
LSSEERREGYLLILKDWLAFFPPVGQQFQIKVDGVAAVGRIDAESCECRGPELPHEHYRLQVPGLDHVRSVTVNRQADTYVLTRDEWFAGPRQDRHRFATIRGAS